MKKQIQLFLTTRDEERLSELLSAAIESISFINDNVWRESPDYKEGITQCDSGRVYLYGGDRQSLPIRRRKAGDVEGPTAGCVIQLLRPKAVGNELHSGRLAAGIDEKDVFMRDFVNDVWKTLRKIGTRGVVRPDGRTDRQYLVGADARNRALEGQLRLLDRAIGMPYTIPA